MTPLVHTIQICLGEDYDDINQTVDSNYTFTETNESVSWLVRIFEVTIVSQWVMVLYVLATTAYNFNLISQQIVEMKNN